MVRYIAKPGKDCSPAMVRAMYSSVRKRCYELQDECDELRQALAEKEAEIQRLKKENQQDRQGWWNLLRSFSRMGSIKFIDMESENSFEHYYERTHIG